MTPAQVLELDAYCKDRFIELVPNQNSLGHFRRFLDHPEYRHLAEPPNGYALSRGRRSPHPYSLHPGDSGSLELLGDLYDQLLPHFTSQRFAPWCDETFDLGQGKSKAMCEEKGRGRVYLDFVLEIDKLARAHGKQTHIASDMLNQYPELYDEVPDDIVIMDWNYDDDAPFDTTCARIAEAGLPFCVVPGTSAWYSLDGRTDTCLANQRLASRAGRDHGAIGYVNTDWGDKGYWHYYAISEVGWAAGAWNGDGDEDGFTRALDLHVYGDAAGHMGRLAYTLGNII